MSEKTNERINENMECQFVDGSERRWLSSGITLDELEEIVTANTDNEFNMESKEFNGMDISMYCDNIKMERDLSGKISSQIWVQRLSFMQKRLMILNMMRKQTKSRFLQSDAAFRN